jgi:hypothetical protein
LPMSCQSKKAEGGLFFRGRISSFRHRLYVLSVQQLRVILAERSSSNTCFLT